MSKNGPKKGLHPLGVNINYLKDILQKKLFINTEKIIKLFYYDKHQISNSYTWGLDNALTATVMPRVRTRGSVENTVAVSTMHLAKCMNC
jgi:hypothetical protein